MRAIRLRFVISLLLVLSAARAVARDWSVELKFGDRKKMVVDGFSYCRSSCETRDYSRDTLLFTWPDGGAGAAPFAKVSRVDVLGRLPVPGSLDVQYKVNIHLRDGTTIKEARLPFNGVSGQRAGIDFTLHLYSRSAEEDANTLRCITFLRVH